MKSERKGFCKTFAFAVLFAMLASVSVGYASAATIYVPDDYAKIQWAVDSATAGDTIIVKDGTYVEAVNVNKRLTLKSGNGYRDCFVHAISQNDHVFEVTANDVNINGFTLTGAVGDGKAGIYLESIASCNVSNNNVSNNYGGIYLDNTSDNVLKNNIAKNNEVGIWMYESWDNTLNNNTMSKNSYNFGVFGYLYIHDIDTSNTVDGKPIYYWIGQRDKTIPADAGFVALIDCTNMTVKDLILKNNRYGLLLAYTNSSRVENIESFKNYFGICSVGSINNTLINNTLTSNNRRGINLIYSDNNTIINNNVSNNDNGIGLYDSSNNTITNNNVLHNDDGILLEYSSRNKIYMNNFNLGFPQIVFVHRPQYDPLFGVPVSMRYHYAGGALVGATVYQGFDNIGGPGTVKIEARAGDAYKNATFEIIGGGVYSLPIYVRLGKAGGLDELILSSQNATSSLEYYLGEKVYWITTMNVTLIEKNEKNIWNSTEKITYTYNGNIYTNYLGNYWAGYDEVDATGDGIGDIPYSRYSGDDNCPLMQPWENYIPTPLVVGQLNIHHNPVEN